MTFTPTRRPWRHEYHRHSDTHLVIGPDHVEVATIYNLNGRRSRCESASNARVIAAALPMLDLLRQLITDPTAETIGRARMLIAEIEGRP